MSENDNKHKTIFVFTYCLFFALQFHNNSIIYLFLFIELCMRLRGPNDI